MNDSEKINNTENTNEISKLPDVPVADVISELLSDPGIDEISETPDIQDADAQKSEPDSEELAKISEPLPPPKTARLTYSAYAEMRPSPTSKYAPMGIFGYIAILLITSIPVVGFIAATVIACVSRKLACSRLATAIVLIRAFFLIVAGIVVMYLIYVLKIDVAGRIFSLLR